jgi:hypothetical protein
MVVQVGKPMKWACAVFVALLVAATAHADPPTEAEIKAHIDQHLQILRTAKSLIPRAQEDSIEGFVAAGSVASEARPKLQQLLVQSAAISPLDSTGDPVRDAQLTALDASMRAGLLMFDEVLVSVIEVGDAFESGNRERAELALSEMTLATIDMARSGSIAIRASKVELMSAYHGASIEGLALITDSLVPLQRIIVGGATGERERSELSAISHDLREQISIMRTDPALTDGVIVVPPQRRALPALFEQAAASLAVAAGGGVEEALASFDLLQRLGIGAKFSAAWPR